MKIIADISKKTWVFNGTFPYSHYIEFFIGFRDNGNLPVIFNNLSFGYVLTFNNKKISSKFEPENNVFYYSTDQEYIKNFVIKNLIPETEYDLNVWAKNSENKWEHTHKFSLSKPEQPFPSWIYDENLHCWNAPVLYPNDDKSYYWNEKIQNWVGVE